MARETVSVSVCQRKALWQPGVSLGAARRSMTSSVNWNGDALQGSALHGVGEHRVVARGPGCCHGGAGQESMSALVACSGPVPGSDLGDEGLVNVKQCVNPAPGLRRGGEVHESVLAQTDLQLKVIAAC